MRRAILILGILVAAYLGIGSALYVSYLLDAGYCFSEPYREEHVCASACAPGRNCGVMLPPDGPRDADGCLIVRNRCESWMAMMVEPEERVSHASRVLFWPTWLGTAR